MKLRDMFVHIREEKLNWPQTFQLQNAKGESQRANWAMGNCEVIYHFIVFLLFYWAIVFNLRKGFTSNPVYLMFSHLYFAYNWNVIKVILAYSTSLWRCIISKPQFLHKAVASKACFPLSLSIHADVHLLCNPSCSNKFQSYSFSTTLL